MIDVSELSEKGKVQKAIGGLVIGFALLENTFRRTLRYISNVDDINDSMILFNRLSFTNKLNLFRDFVEMKHSENETVMKELKEFCKLARDVNDKRNFIMHAEWYNNSFNPEKPLRILKTGKESTLIGEIDIIKISDQCEKVYNELVLFIKRNYANAKDFERMYRII